MGAASTARAEEQPVSYEGPPIEPRAQRPAGSESWPRACSFRHPACVLAERKHAPRVAAVLAAIDRAWDTATGALGLPAPVADAAEPYDVYLVEGALGGGTSFVGDRDLTAIFDSARAFALVDPQIGSACALDHVVVRELVRASQIAAAPATDPGSARAESEALAKLVVPCAMADASGVAEFQRYDARTLIDPLDEAPARVGDLYDRGASLFFYWLDDTVGNQPGAVLRATWALAPTKTKLGAWAWNDEPDGFDVFRSSFKGILGSGATLDDVFVDFAIARAFFGVSDDAMRTLGDAARVRLDFDEPWPKEPARYLSPNPTMPTGASYMRIRKSGEPDEARLRIEIDWEAHQRMRWVVVKLDAAGKPIGTLPIAAMDRSTDANVTVNDLRGVDSVLLVGVGLGAPGHDFDPDDRVWEPHAWTVTVAAK